MTFKNINQTTTEETLVPVYYIDAYKSEEVKEIFNQYKFKNARVNPYLLNLCIDICISSAGDNTRILITYPPSTMFYRKEKNIDSMGNLIMQTKRYINFYFRGADTFTFKSIFSINQKYLKSKKAQHIQGSRETRTMNLDKRYCINFWNKRLLKKIDVIYIIDDVSSTGGTLLACKNTLKDFKGEIYLYSIAH